MATIVSIGSGTSTTNNTTLATGATVTVQAGDWLVVITAASNPHALGTFSGSLANFNAQAWVARFAQAFTPTSTPNDGATLCIHTLNLTGSVTNGTITWTFDDNNPQKAIQVYRVRPDVGETVAFGSAGGGDGSNTTNHSANTVSVANSRIIFGAAAIETNDPVTGDTDTVNGSWSAVITRLADGGTDADAMSCVSQYKTVTATGNQSWACSTTSARDSERAYLTLSSAFAAYSIAAAQGSYALSGTVATMRLGIAPMVADPGSYALTGTAATPEHGWLLSAAAGTYALTGTAASPLLGRGIAATAGSYVLTGANVTLTASVNKVTQADPGTYVLTGQDANLLHGWLLAAAAGSYALSGTAASPLEGFKLDATVAGSYLLTGSTVALNAAAGNKTLLADPGTYLLTGTNVTLTAGHMIAAAPGSYLLTGTAVTLQATTIAPPIRAMGEPPIARDQRRRREAERARALEQQRKARDRLKRAIGRLLEGLPPEFDEPEQLAQAEDNAVQAFNLLRAMRAPAPELDAVSELISTIQAMRIAQPIVQLELARAYNHSHRHLKQKATEDVVMTLLLGE